MKKSIILPALLLAAGTFSGYAENVENANRVIIHTKTGETQVYRFSDLDYMEFDQITEPAAELTVKEGTLTNNSATILLSGDFEYAEVSYCANDENMISMSQQFQPGAEIELSDLRSGVVYNVIALPYDCYGLKGESIGISFTTLDTATDPKIGDYFYSDGTWSDGGLISINADGTDAVWSATRPAPVAGKTVVGIVCVTDPSRIAPEDIADGYTHGYVISTRNITDPDKMNYAAHPETVWFGSYLSEGSETQLVKLTKSAYARISGRQDSQAMLDKYPGEESVECPMFYRASIMSGAAENTSGWFVPSVGQLWDCIANFCSGIVAETLRDERTNSYDFTYYCSHTLNVNVMEEFMKVFENVPEGDKDEIIFNDYNNNYGSGISLRTSNRYEEDSTIVFNLGTSNPGLLEGMAAWRDEDCHARAFLAF